MLGDLPLVAYTALEPRPDGRHERGRRAGRAGLILRRRSETGATLKTTFVTVFEPLGTTAPPLARVGRVASPAETVVLYLETAEGTEHLVINLDAREDPGGHARRRPRRSGPTAWPCGSPPAT